MKLLLSLLSILLLFSCATKKEYKVSNSNENKKDNAPYILLISIDGYRWDYNDIHKPKFLQKFKSEGASVKYLEPSYPTKTFPNHLSIVTGRYPMNHGIIGNRFFAPDLDKSYSLRDSSAVTNPLFYTAKPFWVLAEEQGLKTGTYFWPGSEAKIDGTFPSYYLKYNHGTSHKKRIDTVMEWFSMPKESRPHFVTLYFHDVDSAGHKFGPKAKETNQAVQKVDKSIEELLTKLNRLDLELNVIIVSDHGMAELSNENLEIIGKTKRTKKLLDNFKSVGRGPLVHFYRKNTDFKYITKTMKLLNREAKNFKCYKKNSTPKKLNFRKNIRIGDFVCIANKGWSIGTKPTSIPKGNHGWSQFDGKDMHSILFAKGPNFKNKFETGKIRNIDIYPMMAKILGLEINHKIDGSIQKSIELLK
jgi:alkaline phosphatase D